MPGWLSWKPWAPAPGGPRDDMVVWGWDARASCPSVYFFASYTSRVVESSAVVCKLSAKAVVQLNNALTVPRLLLRVLRRRPGGGWKSQQANRAAGGRFLSVGRGQRGNNDEHDTRRSQPQRRAASSSSSRSSCVLGPQKSYGRSSMERGPAKTQNPGR